MAAALNFEPFLTELRTLVRTTWPDCGEVYDLERVEAQEWNDLTLPYAVIGANSWAEAQARAMGRVVLQGPVTVTYVATIPGNADLFRQKLSDLVNAVWVRGALSTVNVLAVSAVAWGDTNYPNLELTRRKSPQRAGSATFTVVLIA